MEQSRHCRVDRTYKPQKKRGGFVFDARPIGKSCNVGFVSANNQGGSRKETLVSRVANEVSRFKEKAMNKIFYAICGFVSVVFSWLVYRNKRLEKKNCKLEISVEEKNRTLNEVENEISETATVLKKQAEIASSTDTTVVDIDTWLSGKK